MPAGAGRETRDDDASDYVSAARRKIAIAEYHLERLRNEMEKSFDRTAAVPIPIQAHFEGVLMSFIAAADQVAEAVNLMFQLGLTRPSLEKSIVELMRRSESSWRWTEGGEPAALASSLDAWWKTPIAKDAHRIRVRIAHHHYKKSRELEVEEPVGSPPYQTPTAGARELRIYCGAVVQHAAKLGELLGELDLSSPRC